MDNQHKMIKGYRDLTQPEIDLMNRIKEHAEVTKTLCLDVVAHITAQFKATQPAEPLAGDTPTPEQSAEITRLLDANPDRWAALARTDLQRGFMALTRAVAQPTSF